MQAASMQKLWTKYRHKRVKFFDVNSGENTSAVCDFTRHYGVTYPTLFDPDCSLQELFGIKFYPNIIIIDYDGKIRLNGYYRDLNRVDRKLKFLLKKNKSRKENKKKCLYLSEVIYPASDKIKTSPPFERSKIFFKDPERKCNRPSVICDKDGKILATWSLDRAGLFKNEPRGKILLASIFEGKVSETEVVFQDGADNYSPRFIFGRDKYSLLWLNNSSGEYRVVVKVKPEKENIMTVDKDRKPSIYKGDDMHPSGLIDANGRIYVSWYTWEPSWNPKTEHGKSITRHRHIYTSYYDGKKWSDKIKVSPPPEEAKNDDSCDPEMTIDSRGWIWFVWSLDYHPSVHERPYCEKGGPTIFSRYYTGEYWSDFIPVSTYENLGYKEAYDTFAHIAADENGNVWIAWDSLVREPFLGRNIYVRKFDGKKWFPEVKISRGKDNHCSPKLVIGPGGIPRVFWISDRGGFWHIYSSTFSGSNWTFPLPITAGFTDNFHPEPVFDRDGNLYLFWLNVKRDIAFIYYSFVRKKRLL